MKRCPECGAPGPSLWLGAQAGVIYYCKTCGYRGPLIVEEEE